jgi:hypothetical protein
LTLENPIDSEQREPNVGRKSDKQPGNPEPQVSVAVAQSQAEPAPRHCEVTCKIKRNWVDKVGLFVLIVYATFTGLMYRANKKSADAATKAANTAASQLELSTRAWIGVGPSSVPYPLTYPNGANKPVFKLRYTLKNFGHSPAFVAVVGKIFDAKSLGWRDEQRTLCAAAHAKAKPAGRKWGKDSYTILPGDELSYDLFYDGSDENGVPLIIDGPQTIVPVNVGCVLYRSIADTEDRMTPFVASISSSAGTIGNPLSIKLDGRDIPPEKLKVLDLRIAGDTE